MLFGIFPSPLYEVHRREDCRLLECHELLEDCRSQRCHELLEDCILLEYHELLEDCRPMECFDVLGELVDLYFCLPDARPEVEVCG